MSILVQEAVNHSAIAIGSERMYDPFTHKLCTGIFFNLAWADLSRLLIGEEIFTKSPHLSRDKPIWAILPADAELACGILAEGGADKGEGVRGQKPGLKVYSTPSYQPLDTQATSTNYDPQGLHHAQGARILSLSVLPSPPSLCSFGFPSSRFSPSLRLLLSTKSVSEPSIH